ncbi:MAG: hypothetical protein HY876_03885 [Coriobacteriales bacterium]|nr:hypothetical protein [Coriobacteriales bacterium]
MSTAPDYAFFVNSTDSFEDTWVPFFDLLAEYWPQATHVVLNTETKTFTHPRIEVECTQVAQQGEARIPWGECVWRALDTIPAETFVYLQDDYFLYDRVKTEVVDEAARVMQAEGLDCLRLMECGGAGPWSSTDYEWFWSVDRNAKYRIALQAGLWTKSGMRKYLRRHESPWEMEVWGSKRASRMPGKIWSVNRDLFEEELNPVVPYVPTGIVKGRWLREAVEPLFSDHGIEVDYSVRGWWDPSAPPRSSLLTKARKLPKFAWDRIRSL